MIQVTPHRRHREDRSGDPLDGLVNLFDLGIVLSVAFLLAALSSLHLAGTIIRRGLQPGVPSAIAIAPGSRVAPLPPPGAQTIGPGVQVGVVYRLADGRLVYVQGPPQAGHATGGTSPPHTGGTSSPHTGGTSPPHTGGTSPPHTGGTSTPHTGGISLPKSGNGSGGTSPTVR